MNNGLDPALPAGHTRRDRAVDAVVFCLAVFLGMVVLGVVKEQGDLPGWAAELDPLLGLVACCALWWRRGFPLAVALIGLPSVALATSALPAGAVIVTNLALRLRWRQALLMLGAYVVCMVPSPLLSGAADDLWFDAAFSLAYLLAAFASGNALRSRRLLVERLRADAERARAENERRLADARRGERQAIAREMHDVLAHRISLLSVHAGALAYRTRQAEAGAGPALSSAEVAESAEVIRGNAHQAVEELQEVLHLLRAEGGGEPVSLLPRIADIDGLVADARATGQSVDFRTELAADAVRGLRLQMHRTAYRVAQEGLTNARKHAPGTPVSVRLAGGPGGGLTVEVRNGLPAAPRADGAVPGTGAGLTGLAERVRLDGGTLDHTAADGTFTLRARLPWPTR
ncbi:sensor histidine kinase [Streptomyces rugosispiralis]|uniref:histidine kinase n=1 Tax=Streptomyces rugosispiralis TaxID=2967341 RepID=A0ABT1UR49_9ACTN|nr:histidine kinase [Streptomyces rugosispiralis]MCQ8187035.1 histidine kinase [Streptomyces rugosispiralis]